MATRKLKRTGPATWLYRPKFPHAWTRCRLYDLASWTNGMAFRNIHFSAGGRPIIKIAEIKTGITGRTKFTDADYDRCYYIRQGDMLFSWSGQPETSIDVSWWSGPEGWLNQHIFKVTPSDSCDKYFFYYLLKYLKTNFIAIAGNKQTTGLGHVTKVDLETIEVRIPPKSVQRAIARILGTLDNKIELNRRMNQTLKAMAKAIFKSWFVDFDAVRAKAEGREPKGMDAESAALFPDCFEDSLVGKIPSGWRYGHLGDDFRLTMGQSPPGTTYNENREGVPFFQGRTDFGFRYPSVRMYCTAPKRMANKDDTLVSVRAPVGAINMALERCCVGRGLAALRHRTGSRSYTYYTLCRLQQALCSFEAEGTVFGSIGKRDFKSIDCIVPPAGTVTKFEHAVWPLDERIENNHMESCTLKTIRNMLLLKLLSGEIRVKDAERFVGKQL